MEHGIKNYDCNQNGAVAAAKVSPLDAEEFRRQGYMVIDFIADYFNNVHKYPVCSNVEPGYLHRRLPSSAPFHPESMETILNDVQHHIVPGISHWQSPNYFGYFPCNTSTAGILGEALVAAFNVPGFNWISSPAATELESHVMDWLADMLSLPPSFKFSGGGTGGGVLLGTTCEAVLACVVAARDRTLNKIGRDKIGKLVVYASDQTHCSFQKSAQIAGIFPENFRKIAATKSTSYGMNPKAFRAAAETDIKAGLFPLFLCATVGTTSIAAVDPIAPLCQVANQYGIWVHIDAAYAGSACICPEYRPFIDGVEQATSFSFNAHKWFLTSLDCCCLWVKEPQALVDALSTSPEYLRNKATESQQVVDYKDWGITLSRRFRALKLWMVIRSNGVSNLRRHIRSNVEMARHFESLVARDPTFEVMVPRLFSMVCFRVSPKALLVNPKIKYVEMEMVNEVNKEIMESVNASGKLLMTHTVVGGEYVMRLAVGGTLTENCHVELAWKVIKEHANVVLARRLRIHMHANGIRSLASNERETPVAPEEAMVPLALNAIGLAG